VKLATNDINIEDVRNPNDLKTNQSLANIKINRTVPEDLIKEVDLENKAYLALVLCCDHRIRI